MDKIKPFKDDIVQKYLDGMGSSAIAKEYNVNSYFIYNLLKEEKIDIKKKNVINKNDILPKVKELFLKDYSAYKISKELNISKRTTLRYLEKLNLSTSSKSTQRKDQLKNYSDDIINQYKQGKSTCQIAKEYNTFAVSILKILEKHGIETRPVKKYKHNENFFEKIDTEEKAYVLGWWYSDGNNTGKGIRLSITDLDILQKIKDIFGHDGDLYIVPPKTEKHKTKYCLSMSSLKLSEDLTKLGCMSNKTFLLKFPDENIVPFDLIHHFVRGYFDGDGSIGAYGKKKRPVVQIVGTRHMMEGILKAADIKGTFSQRFPERCKDNYTIHIGSFGSLLKFYDYIYKDSTIYLQRKFDRYREIVGVINSRKKQNIKR